MYKQTTDYIIRDSDQALIPKDDNNSDYIEYLKWVAAGNTAPMSEGHSFYNIIPEFQSVIVTNTDT